MTAETGPRIFMLGPDGWEETLEHYERRSGEPVDPGWVAKAAEVAPGVQVLLLSTGGGIGPDGQVPSFGARIAVWAEADTLTRLRDCLAHLEEYITRRAQQLAAPAIADAQGTAVRLVDAARHETQRQEDLVRELGRRLAAQERQTAQAEAARRALAALLGYQEPSALPLAALVAEVETRLAEKEQR